MIYMFAYNPFDTIKRHFGLTHILLKGLQKVNGEMNLIIFCYNFMRTKNIPGFDNGTSTSEKKRITNETRFYKSGHSPVELKRPR